MAKSENQKRKLLYLADLLRRETDETHGLTVQQMIDEKYYRKRRGRRTKPKIVLKGCLTGFTQIDLDWDEDDIARIFYSTTPAAEAATPAMADHIEIIKVKGEN